MINNKILQVMNTIYELVAYIFFFLLATKIILHIYLDDSNGYKVFVSPLEGMKYFLPYENEVSPEYEKKKKLCNKIQPLTIYLFILLILILLLKNFLHIK